MTKQTKIFQIKNPLAPPVSLLPLEIIERLIIHAYIASIGKIANNVDPWFPTFQQAGE